MSRHAALGPRVLTVLVGLPFLLLLLWSGGLWWVAVITVITILGAAEFTRLQPALNGAERTLVILGAAAMGAVVAWVPAPLLPWVLAAAAVVVLGAGVVPVWATRRSQSPWGARPAWATVALGLAYLGGPAGILVRWRAGMAVEVVLAFFAIVWANDIAAYFVGLALGRHKLAPHVSPGKSWEGAAAGVAIAAAVGGGLSPLLGLAPSVGVLFGVATSVASQLGDLFESAIKRGAGAKDSGTLLPGHGGVLDRFDGILFAAPVGYVLLHLWSR